MSSSSPPGLGGGPAPLLTEQGVAEPTSISPCSRACPLGINVQRYVGLAHRGLLFEALEVITEQCPMPGVCGYLCQRPCEWACKRGELDRPVAIRWLKSAAARAGLAAGAMARQERWRPSPWRVAVVGAGPAGLGAARTLARLGHRVTIFERRQSAGGLLDEVVPAFRMPRRVLRADTEAILTHPGIELETEVEIGRDGQGLAELRARGFAAVVLATGAGREAAPASELPTGVLSSLTFLRRAAEGRVGQPGGAAVVLGNTSTALAAARTLARGGWSQVTMVASRDLDRWPADPEDLSTARDEGVTLRGRLLFHSYESIEGRVSSVNTRIAIGSADRPESMGEPIRVPAALVITDVPRAPEVSAVARERSIRLTPRGALAVDAMTMQTSMPGVFAAGECATGPKTVVEALATGKRAALMVDRYLDGHPLSEALPQRARPWFELVVHDQTAPHPGLNEKLPAGEGTAPDVADEASRCLRCGPCGECDRCMPDCLHERISANQEGTPLRASPETDCPESCRTPGSDRGGVPEALPKHRRGSTTKSWARRTSEVGQSVSGDALIVRAPAGRASDGAALAATVDPARCTGCGRCEAICPHQAIVVRFRLSPEGEQVGARVDRPACRGCGRCVPACPFGAVELAPGHHDTRLLWAALSEQVVVR